jgi:hypothetical protein
MDEFGDLLVFGNVLAEEVLLENLRDGTLVARIQVSRTLKIYRPLIAFCKPTKALRVRCSAGSLGFLAPSESPTDLSELSFKVFQDAVDDCVEINLKMQRLWIPVVGGEASPFTDRSTYELRQQVTTSRLCQDPGVIWNPDIEVLLAKTDKLLDVLVRVSFELDLWGSKITSSFAPQLVARGERPMTSAG